MPVTRTVNGLKDEWSCDDIEAEWQNYEHYGYAFEDYTADKKEGTACMAYLATSVGAGWYMPAYHITPMLAGAGHRIHLYHRADDAKHSWYLTVCCIGKPGCAIGPYQGWPVYHTTVLNGVGAEAWTLKKGTIPSTVTDYPEQRWACWLIGFTDYGSNITDFVDHIVTSTTQYLTITGLSPGQLVEVYRVSDGVKIAEDTVGEGGTELVFDIDNQDYPLYLQLKVYATDGVTLVETTTPARMCGGDTWYWVPPFGTLGIETDAFILIRSAGTGDPKEANITATLLTPAGAPAPGKTIYFTTGRGTVTPTSDTTDANGEAHTVLTSDTHGIAVVKATWLGDADIPAAVGYATHHVLHNEEAPDATKKFQLFIEGIEFVYESGQYSAAMSYEPQEFGVEIPTWLSTLTKRGLVSIYRYGVKDFSGVFSRYNRRMAHNPVITIAGTDSSALLETRVVTIKDYSAEALIDILNDLFDSFPCGLSLGSVADYPNLITATFADETFVTTLARICDMIGWYYRVNIDNSVDIKPDFGGEPDVEFVEGESLFQVDNGEDFRNVNNSIRMRGVETLVSTAYDSTSIEEIGLIEDVAFEKSIGNQGVLDIAAASALAKSTSGAQQITAEVLDDYTVGTWGVGDWVTLTCDKVELSGLYRVIKITRDMADPTYALVEFANKAAVTLNDLFARLKRELKDISAKTAI